MTKVKQALWYADDMEGAVRLYTSLVPESEMGPIKSLPTESPSGPAGTVLMVDFTLGGQNYSAMQAGPLDSFNHSVSIMIECDTQDEIDRLWEGLGEGGSYEQCGWLKDRWGLSWQITPRILNQLVGGADKEKGRRAAEAMLKMTKLDIATIERAAAGEEN